MSDLDEIRWINQNRIAVLQLTDEFSAFLQKLPTENTTPIVQKATMKCVGAAFSLWRAVPLVNDLNVEDTVGQAKSYIAKVLADNAILYGDDKRMRAWSFGYYVNNAIYRIDEVLKSLPELACEAGRQKIQGIMDREPQTALKREDCEVAIETLKAIVIELPTIAEIEGTNST